jgi:hypothetical protein
MNGGIDGSFELRVSPFLSASGSVPMHKLWIEIESNWQTVGLCNHLQTCMS